MKSLKIHVYKHGSSNPETTVTIPGSVLRLASRLIPRRAQEALLGERGGLGFGWGSGTALSPPSPSSSAFSQTT
ncbi:MAG TPA: hypothetical protein VFS50_09965 [Meiothermus sp.]|nr:hypothetical protein [Meiothermus sp.]